MATKIRESYPFKKLSTGATNSQEKTNISKPAVSETVKMKLQQFNERVTEARNWEKREIEKIDKKYSWSFLFSCISAFVCSCLGIGDVSDDFDFFKKSEEFEGVREEYDKEIDQIRRDFPEFYKDNTPERLYWLSQILSKK